MRQSILGSVIAGLFFSLVFSAATIQAQTFSTPWMHSAQGDWATPWGALDPRILFYPPSWGQLTGATGNWDGIRSRLSDQGISVFGSYESESAGNPVGEKTTSSAIRTTSRSELHWIWAACSASAIPTFSHRLRSERETVFRMTYPIFFRFSKSTVIRLSGWWTWPLKSNFFKRSSTSSAGVKTGCTSW